MTNNDYKVRDLLTEITSQICDLIWLLDDMREEATNDRQRKKIDDTIKSLSNNVIYDEYSKWCTLDEYTKRRILEGMKARNKAKTEEE